MIDSCTTALSERQYLVQAEPTLSTPQPGPPIITPSGVVTGVTTASSGTASSGTSARHSSDSRV